MSLVEIQVGGDETKIIIKSPALFRTLKDAMPHVKEDKEAMGVFYMKTDHHNMQRLHQVFQGAHKPIVTIGGSVLENLRNRVRWYMDKIKVIRFIKNSDIWPVEPNGKFIPYKHQTRIIGLLTEYPFVFVGADCGTGKTGSTLRAIEIMIQRGEVSKGKVLVTAPLSILETSWVEDAKKFTWLNPCVLWTSAANERIYGEEVFLADLGPKPDDAISVKKRTKTFFKQKTTGSVRESITVLDEATGPWEKYECKVSCAYFMDKEPVVFGEVRGRTFEMDNTKEKMLLEKLEDPQYDVYFMNHDGVRIYEKLLKDRFEWVVIDESTKIKTYDSGVTESHVAISWNCKRRTALSGTPNPNGFQDLWSQYNFLDRGLTFSRSIKDFLVDYFRPVKIGNFKIKGRGGESKGAAKWVIRSVADANRLIERAHNVGIFIKQRDCVDLPSRTDLKREVILDKKTSDMYRKMEEEFLLEVQSAEGGDVVVEAKNILAKTMKLRQLLQGFIVDNEGNTHKLPSTPKLDDLDALLEEMGDSKVVMACQFTNEIDELLKRYAEKGIIAIRGGMKKGEAATYVRQFQTEEKPQYAALQPKSAAHGITLTEAPYFVHLSLDYNFEFYYQICKRIERIGQKNKMFMYHMLARLDDGSETIDHDLFEIVTRIKTGAREMLFNYGRSDDSITDLNENDEAELAEEIKNRIRDRVSKR